MPLRIVFRDVDDFLQTLKLTEEKAMPLIDWLDTLHSGDQQKVSSALFYLIARRNMVENKITKDEMMELISIIYDVVTREDYSRVPWANDD